MPSIRSRKSTRPSSPFRPANSSPATGLVIKKEKAQMSLDSWVEPPPKHPTASFEEHGFARGGVLENMAPLGQPPTARLKAKLRGGNEMHRHSMLGKNDALSAGEDALSTPEMTPAVEPPQPEEDQAEEEPALPPSLEPQKEDEDDDYIPNGVRSASRSGKVAMKNGVKAVTPHRDSIVPPFSATPTTRTPALDQIILKAVRAAMKKSRDEGRPTVGEAVQRLYDDSCHNQSYARLLDGILNERATPQEQSDFRTYIKRAKKMAKLRDRQSLGAAMGSLHSSPVSPAKTRNSSLTSVRPADTIATIGTAPTTPSIRTIATSSNVPAPSGFNSLSNVPHLPPIQSPNQNNNIFAPSSRSSTPPFQFTANGSSSKPIEMVSTRTKTKSSAPPQGGPPPPVLAKQPPAKAQKSPKPKGKAAKAQAKAAALEIPSDDSELSDVNEDIIMSEPPESIAPTDDHAAPPPPKAQRAKLILKNNPRPSLGRRPKSSTATPVPTSGKRTADDAGIDENENEIQVIQPRTTAAAAPPPPRRSGRSRNGASQPPQPVPNAAGPQQNGARAGAFPDNAISLDGYLATPEAASPRPAESGAPSRLMTRPTTPAGAHPAKKRKTNNGPAKMKTSPVKAKSAVASSSRAVGGVPAQVGADDSDSSSDEDVCASCGLGGLIIGCDHCEDWYHFACAEPPIPHDTEAPDDFVCHKCRRLFAAAEASRAVPTKYDWVKVLENALPALENLSKWYRLPQDIREYFEGVKTAADGVYEEEPAREIPLNKEKGYFAKPDPYRLIDANKKVILCHKCGQSAAGKRDIIKCDHCPNHWHLDCLDPPAAVSPVNITVSGMTRRAWKCPLHVDHDLKNAVDISTQQISSSLKRKRASNHNLDADETILRHRIRRPKILTPQDVALPRGARNSGLIEVVNNDDESEDEEDWVYDDKESRPEDAVLKRIPKQVIVADFISSIKRQRLNEQARKANLSQNPTTAHRPSTRVTMKHKGVSPITAASCSSLNIFVRPIVEQQAALNLAQFAQKEQDIGLTAENVHSLVGNLIAEASPEVISLVSGTEAPQAPSLSSGALERQYLEKLQALITRKLTGIDS